MNNITIVTIGKIKDINIAKTIEDITKRLNRVKFIELKEIKEKNIDILKKKEFELIEPLIKSENKNYLLWEHGKNYNTKEFFKEINSIQNNNIFFFITGPFGPDKHLLFKIPNHLSISPLTLTHEMAKLILVEQVYRIQEIGKGSNYHK